MAINTAKLAATGSRLIRENGRKITITRLERSTDPHAGPVAVLTATPYAVQVAIAKSEIDGELVRQDDVRYLVSLPGIPGGVAVGDIITDGGLELRVTMCKDVRPGKRAALLKITARA